MDVNFPLICTLYEVCGYSWRGLEKKIEPTEENRMAILIAAFEGLFGSTIECDFCELLL